MKRAVAIDPSILREYDVRGIVGDTLDEPQVYALARAFGSILAAEGGRLAAVAFDGRESSPAFASAAATGLSDCGLEVVRIGLGPSPMLYFAVKSLPADGGIMVTGSHNPPSYNGLKFMKLSGGFHGAAITAMGERARDQEFAVGNGSVADRDVSAAYVDALAGGYRQQSGLKVAWDSGNGAAGPIMARLTRRLPGRHISINVDVDGRFPNHHPDPTVPENLTQLIDVVRGEGCDLGVALDGDGDRVGAVDSNGRIVWADQLMVLFAESVLADQPGATIISEVKASQVLFDEIARMGGQPLMWKTGHSLLKSKMAETGAPLAGEMSGHIFFADRYFGFDDGLYAAVRLLDLLATDGPSLAERIDALPSAFNTPELRFTVDDTRKFEIVEEVRGRLRAEGADVIDVDGVRVRTADGWWLLRASNTQNVLVARCESRDPAGLERLKASLRGALALSGVSPPE